MVERIANTPEVTLRPEVEARGAYRIFTVKSGWVEGSAVVCRFSLKAAGVDIPAILVGQEGRGREVGVLPVQLPEQLYREWQETGQVKIFAAELGRTQSGKPKLFAKERADAQGRIIVVFYTEIGFRGGSSHTGDRTGEVEKDSFWGTERPKFSPFPGEILACGVIAQGHAGRMGSGEQLVAVLPKDTVFRTGYSGRLYGAPDAHYYKWDGEKILSLTWQERQASELF